MYIAAYPYRYDAVGCRIPIGDRYSHSSDDNAIHCFSCYWYLFALLYHMVDVVMGMIFLVGS